MFIKRKGKSSKNIKIPDKKHTYWVNQEWKAIISKKKKKEINKFN